MGLERSLLEDHGTLGALGVALLVAQVVMLLELELVLELLVADRALPRRALQALLTVLPHVHIEGLHVADRDDLKNQFF